jgi:hypothetical protein
VEKKKIAFWLLKPEQALVRIERVLDQLLEHTIRNPLAEDAVRVIHRAREVLEDIPLDVRPRAALLADLYTGIMWQLDIETLDLKRKGAASVLGAEKERLRHLHSEWDRVLDQMPKDSTQGQMLRKLKATFPKQNIARSTFQRHLRRRAEGRHLP